MEKISVIRKNFIDILFALVIGGSLLYNIGNLTQLYVLHDEFGYWANAALAAGYNWSDIAMMSPYYSYGYSLFLIPLLLLFHNSVWMYRAAIVLNAIMYVFSYFISLWCAKKILPDQSRSLRSFLCLFTALYGNNLLQVNIAWGEALLYLTYWIMFATLLKYLENPHVRWLLCLGVEAGFLYAVHQRALGVVAALVLTYIMLFVRNKKLPWKKILISAATVILLAFLMILIKRYMQEILWSGQDEQLAGHNDYAGQIEKIILVFTSIEGLQKLLYSFTGKIFGIILASFGLLIGFLYKSCKCIFERKKNENRPLYFFLLSSLVMMLGVSAVFWLHGGRLDGIIYSRYTEFIMGPILLISVGCMFTEQTTWQEKIGYVPIVLVSGYVTNSAVKDVHTFTRIHNVTGNLFYDRGEDTLRILPCITFLLVVGVLIYAARSVGGKKIRFIAAFIMVILWFLASRDALKNEVNIGQKYLQELSIVADAIEEVVKDEPIYYLERPEVTHLNRRVENLQFLMPGRSIYRAEYESLEELPEEHCLVQYGIGEADLSVYEVIMQSYGMVLMVPANSAIAERFHAYQKDVPYRFFDTQIYSETGEKKGKPYSDHKRGVVAACQDLVLSSGTYEAIMTVEVSEIRPARTVGYIEVVYDGVDDTEEILFKSEIDPKQVRQNEDTEWTFLFTVPDTVRNAKIRFYTNGNSKILVKDLSYKRKK